MRNKKGFTIVELLAAVAILSILSIIAIAAVMNLSKNAREEKDAQNINSLRMAAESYAQANREYLPRQVGEWTRIDISELSENNYIKEEITDQNDVSCMESSYVEITKISKNDYTYTPHLICGDKELTKPAEEEVATEPVVTITINGLSNEGGELNSGDLSNANYSIVFKGDKNDKNIGILSYNYSLFVKKKDKGDDTPTEQFEVFNSGNLLGHDEPEISVNDVGISEYLNITGENEVIIQAYVINEKGVRATETSKIKVFISGSAGISDTTPPLCPTTPEGKEGEPDDSDWLSKENIKKNETRQISLTCSDGNGSGCKREKFSRTWPNEQEKREKKSIRNSTITITDNVGLSTECPVRVQIDAVSPRISVLKDNNIKNTVTLPANSDYDNLLPTKTIESNGNYYNNLYNNKWLNQKNYSNGITYSIEIEDDVGVRSIKWETSKGAQGEDISNEQIDIDTSQNQGFTFRDEGENKKIYTLTVSFTHDGEREGSLLVEDYAGNKSLMIIKADIDRKAPEKPTAKMYKWNDETEPNSSANLLIYNQNNKTDVWSNKKIYTEILDTTDLVSGVAGYYYTTTGAAPHLTDVEGKKYNIKKEGKSTITYKVCDNANNCVTTATLNVQIDQTKPTCTNVVKCKKGSDPETNSCSGWLNKSGSYVKITAKCEDGLSGCVKNEIGPKTYNYEINTTKAGAADELGKSVTVEDKAGNTATCKSDIKVQIDWTAPSTPTVEVYPWKSNDKFPTSGNDLGTQLKVLSNGCAVPSKETTCKWISTKVFTKALGSTDNLSGVDYYRFTTTGTTTNEQNVKRATRNIEADGESSITYSACDKAGNCSAGKKVTVKISKYGPTVSCKMDKNGKISSVSISTNGSGIISGDCNDSRIKNNKLSCTQDNNYKSFVTSMAKTSSGIQAAWGDENNPNVCGRTYYGYVRVKSEVGIETIAKCSGSYSTTTCSKCNSSHPEECPWVTSCRSGYTTLYVNINDPEWKGNDLWDVWAGAAYHSLNGRNDKIYVLPESEQQPIKKGGVTWVKVYIPSFEQWWSGENNKYVYIAKNCLGPYNKVCPYTQCPG